MRNIFFDNASTTKVADEIINEIRQLNEDYYYNPSSLYSCGRKCRKVIEDCRKDILEILGAERGANLVFTGSATEANNMALFGSVKKNTRKILVSMGEHPSVYNTALELKNRGHNVVFVNLDKSGCVDVYDYISKLDETVDLVSIMHVNNETGAINDIEYLVNLAREANPNVIFHCDGVQAVGKVDIDLGVLGVDLYTMSGHKVHGLRGIGALYIKNDKKIKPIIFGGNQENGLRSGTENLMGIVSLKMAIKKACKNLKHNQNCYKNLKKRLVENLNLSGVKYRLFSNENCVDNIVSIGFEKCRAETILNMLSDEGIFVGNGSACSSKKSGNRVLENMGVGASDIEGNLRISFCEYNSVEEIDEFVEVLKRVVDNYISNAR